MVVNFSDFYTLTPRRIAVEALAAARAGLIESPSPKVEPDASAGQFLVSLMIPVADVQSNIAEEFVLHEGFPCSFPPLYI